MDHLLEAMLFLLSKHSLEPTPVSKLSLIKLLSILYQKQLSSQDLAEETQKFLLDQVLELRVVFVDELLDFVCQAI